MLQATPLAASPQVVFSGLALQYRATDLRPFTAYSFQVVAENGAGNVTSIATVATTAQAPPSSFDPPSVVVLSSTEIMVAWDPPEELNGALLGYQVYRNREPLLLELTTMLLLLEQDLRPFTQYEYFVEVCASGGCLNSSAEANTTFEALPEMVSDFTVSAVDARSLVLTWQAPVFPNGEITEYIVAQLGTTDEAAVVVFRGLDFTITLSDLMPFTDYSFSLMVCNSVGCVRSNTTQVCTLETDPEGLDVPQLRNLTSTSVAIRWTPPARANGIVTTFVLRRGVSATPDASEIIFQGLNTSFNDLDLLADTLYFYTVEAVNGGGSVVSSPSFFRTVPDLPEGVDPPVLVVSGATEVAVSWSPPRLANGEISSYMLYQDNRVVFAGVGFSYTAINLDPFTTYSFFVEVCNQAGCASSIASSAQTEQALATGVAPPLVTALGSIAVRVSWAAPTRPNGLINQYQIRRRLLGLQISENNQNIIVNPDPDDALTFDNSGLTPFTSYEYRLRVTNGAGSVFSEWVAVQTNEDIPSGLSLPLFDNADISARMVTATWAPPTSPNGIIMRYVLEYRLAVDPVTLEAGAVIAAQEVAANVTVAAATGLSPVTEYQFRVVVINGAGRGAGPFESIQTREDVPEGIQPIIVEQRTGSTLLLTWTPPLTPNGVVLRYMISLDGEVVYSDLPLVYTATSLEPFTSYNLQLSSCTSAGCASGSIQSATTAEVPPTDQGIPSLSIIESGNVGVRWSPPARPNGIIVRYAVLRRVTSDTTAAAVVVFSTNNTLGRAYTDTDVRPAQSYDYSIRTANSAGETDGDFGSVVTPEAAPLGLAAPTLRAIGATEVLVSWLPPAQPNGVVTMYQVFRTGAGGSQNVSVFASSDPNLRSSTDRNLLPFTTYGYVVQACTAAGCSLSPLSNTMTGEAPPTDLRPPTLSAVSDTRISIMWEEPGSANGVVTRYTLSILPPQISVVVSETLTDLSRTISNLRPFTQYTITLEACNTAGCVTSNGTVTTLEAIPEFTSLPQATVVNATALRVSWVEPAIPNGVITLYELRRNGTLVFNGPERTFVDAQLVPSQFYSYTLRAFTAVGPGEESAASAAVATPPDTPVGVSPPQLQATSSGSIRATWAEPAMPNGEIQRYVLLLNGEGVFDGIGFQFDVMDLSPFTSYAFQLMVCTTTCNSSDSISARTLEAPPTGQLPPNLAETDGQSVVVSWSPPTTPNGIVTRYEVERRQVQSSPLPPPSPLDFVPAFSGPGLSFNDSNSSLRPATTYEYRVTAFNSVGASASDATTILLADAPPEGVALPDFTNITANSVLVVVTAPPRVPNGVIAEYRLLQDRQQVGSIVPPNMEFVVAGLNSFTAYVFNIEACTSGGCNTSASSTVRTGEATPTDLSPPVHVVAMPQPRAIEISWRSPQQPNGIILRFVS